MFNLGPDRKPGIWIQEVGDIFGFSREEECEWCHDLWVVYAVGEKTG